MEEVHESSSHCGRAPPSLSSCGRSGDDGRGQFRCESSFGYYVEGGVCVTVGVRCGYNIYAKVLSSVVSGTKYHFSNKHLLLLIGPLYYDSHNQCKHHVTIMFQRGVFLELQ